MEREMQIEFWCGSYSKTCTCEAKTQMVGNVCLDLGKRGM